MAGPVLFPFHQWLSHDLSEKTTRLKKRGLNTNPRALALALAEKMLKLTGADPEAIEDAIHEMLDAPVVAAQGLKALSDPRSAALFLERGDKRRQRRRREQKPEPSPENAVFIRQLLTGGL